MKYILYISFFLFLNLGSQAQKLSFRCNYHVFQVQNWEVKQRINLDTSFYDGYRFYLDSFNTKSKVVSEIPGLSLEFRFPSNWFVEAGLNYSIFGYHDSFYSSDSLKRDVTFRMHRASATWEGGYYFRKAKIFKPFFSVGLILNKMFAGFPDNINNTRYEAYKEYFKQSPFFLSMQFRTGLKFGMISVGFAYSTSLTKTSSDGKMGKYNSFSLLTLSTDLIRTSSLKKSQYQSRFESDDFIVKKSQTLKQTENSWVFGLTYYRFINLPYIVAYSVNQTDVRIEPKSPPSVAFIPTIGGKTLNAKNTKRTFYAQSNSNFAIIAMNYKKVIVNNFNSAQPVSPGGETIITSYQDIRMPYLDFNIGGGHGFKIKTTPRSFIYMEYDAKLHTIFKLKHREIYDIPTLKRFFLTLGLESGFRRKHSGFSLNFSRTLGRLDKYEFYEKMNCLSLKFTYDISSK